MRVYIASPFFNEKEIGYLEEVEQILLNKGINFYSPRLNEDRNEEVCQKSWWSKQTFLNDVKNINSSDCVVMLYHGNYSDSGTSWECGYAYGIHKPVIVIHLCENEDNGSNLMIHEGCHANLLSIKELEEYDFDKLACRDFTGKMFE